jgi:N-acetylglucosaminyldiphosphoundecaprenol N-acetyl-beta-D-mannosaminyltransferase
MKILDINITTSEKSKILAEITKAIENRTKFTIFTPNPEMIELAFQNYFFPIVGTGRDLSLPRTVNFSKLLNTSDINLPDGVGLKIASYLKQLISIFSRQPTHYTLPPTTTHGLDFMLDLCHEAEKQNWSVGLIGGFNKTAEKTKENLLKKFPNLKINYVYGDFEYSSPRRTISKTTENSKTDKPNADNRQPRTDNRVSEIPTTYLDLLFVALGTPKEQIWIGENRDSFPATVFMEVGGSFDVISGTLKRAPQLIQSLNLEWLFRLIQEPKRLKRQLKLFSFLWHVLTTKNSISN